MSQKFYVTTPIYYVNDKPHIGHAYTTILADVLTRYHKTFGEETFFLTGVDEHGQKVQQAAQKRGVSEQQHCDEYHLRFKDLWTKLAIDYNKFIRTTDKAHKDVVQFVLQKLYDEKMIESAEYEGWYSVAEERFITDIEKESGQFRDVIRLKEKNWFFKMSRFQDALIKHIHDNPAFIQPEHRKNEILGFLRQPLGDLCISRPKSRMSWGIEIPFDRDYVTYVWFDALINYISGIGFPSEDYKKWWPADVHLIGKDILTTHCVYWSTMLLALQIPLPKTIFAHGWWLIGETKMSKSLGNVVNPLDLVDKYGVEPVRYFLMSEMILGQDANFTEELFIKRYNSDLANDFGNLLNRVGGLINKLFDGKIPKPLAIRENVPSEGAMHAFSQHLPSEVRNLINQFKVDQAIGQSMRLVQLANKYIEEQAPWKVVKENKELAGHILYCATSALRIAAVCLTPVMPTKCLQVLEVFDALGSSTGWRELKVGTQIKPFSPLFMRIEVSK